MDNVDPSSLHSHRQGAPAIRNALMWKPVLIEPAEVHVIVVKMPCALSVTIEQFVCARPALKESTPTLLVIQVETTLFEDFEN